MVRSAPRTRWEDLLPELLHPPRIGSGRRRIPLVPHGLQNLAIDIPAVEPGHIEGRLHPGRGLRHAAQFVENPRAEEAVDKTHGLLHLPGCRLPHPALGMPLGIGIHKERVQSQHAVNRMGTIPGQVGQLPTRMLHGGRPAQGIHQLQHLVAGRLVGRGEELRKTRHHLQPDPPRQQLRVAMLPDQIGQHPEVPGLQ